MSRDILLITIDCWRHDAPEQMPKFRSLAADWGRRDVMCAGAATNAAFPALFTGRHGPNAYTETGAVRESVTSLPDVLSEAGYETGGFVASNPFLGKWSSRFDTFWNDGMTADGVTANRERFGTARKLASFATLSPRVTATDVFKRASAWWQQASSPRFCWLHLMEPHAPYYPGLKRGVHHGIFKTYRALLEFSHDAGSLSQAAKARVRDLHFEAVRHLDDQLSEWLAIFDDSLVVVTGDHGEEFDHGSYGHARLYDETVRVPLYTNASRTLPDTELIRQQDLSPLVCRAAGVDTQTEWNNKLGHTEAAQCMLSRARGRNRIWAGIRTATEKLIYEFDWEGTDLGTEAYNLAADPLEMNPVDDPDSRLVDELDGFLANEGVQAAIGTGKKTGIDEDVESRLEELGYK